MKRTINLILGLFMAYSVFGQTLEDINASRAMSSRVGLKAELQKVQNNFQSIESFYAQQFIWVCESGTVGATGTTGYIIPINETLAGYYLTRIEVQPGASLGTAAPAVDVWKIHGSTETKLTTTAASFTSNGVMNTSAYQVNDGDRLKVDWSLGSGTAPTGLTVTFTFTKTVN